MVYCGANNSSTMPKARLDGEVYNVLLEDQQHQPSGNQPCQLIAITTDGAQMLKKGEHLLGSRRKSKTGRRRSTCPLSINNCFCWTLLLAVGATCVAVFIFHLWLTWHLQYKVTTLQAQIDSLNALDLQDLRTQLRDLCELRDLNSNQLWSEREDVNLEGLPGLPTSPDEDQDDDPYEGDLLLDSLNTVETSAATNNQHGDTREDDLTSADHGDSEDDAEDDEADDSSDEEMDEDVEDTDESSIQVSERRRKRQTDLSSHTQDGVPIFDRGYGISLNRTEGLRIYQSLLSRGNPSSSSNANDPPPVTESPILPHHRQNSFWNDRKENRRHHHQHHQHRTTVSPNSGTATGSEEENSGRNVPTSSANEHLPVRQPVNPSRHGSVEFRHSRVKPSSGEGSVTSVPLPPVTHSPIVHQRDHNKVWATSRTSPTVSALEDERINAATAPAVLTTSQSVTSSSPSVPRVNRPLGVFKVNQPTGTPSSSPFPRYPPQQTASDRDDPVPPRSSIRRRVNRKQLRDLTHVTTAVHLVADPRGNNTSTSNYDNQVEVASRNELGLHTSWKLASSSMDSTSTKTPSLIKIDGATMTIKQSGLYLVYAQVHYLDEHSTNAYEIFVNTEPFLRCVTSAFSSSSADSSTLPRANTCYTAGATQLREGDKLFLRDIEPLRYSVLQPSKTFFGLVRLAPIPDFL